MLRFDRKAIERYLDSEGGGQYELRIHSDGSPLVYFFNRHGSLFDVVHAEVYLKCDSTANTTVEHSMLGSSAAGGSTPITRKPPTA